jgi:hypothetical protein
MRHLLAFILLAGLTAYAGERALVDTVTGDVLQYQTVGEDQTPNPAKWLQVVREAQPAFNPEVQKLVGVVTPSESTLTISWDAVNLTQEELDARAADAAVNAAAAVKEADRIAKRTQLANAIATLRQWKVDADNTTVTAGNAVATLQVIVDQFGTLCDNLADLLEVQRIDQ